MKTAIVCWCLFSITFTSGFPSQPSSDANALEKSRIKEDSHSSDVNYDTEEQESLFFETHKESKEEKKDSRSSQMNPRAVEVENNQIVDERYAENEPEITDEFLDGYRPNELSNDFPQDDLINMDIDAEDSSVEIE